ncbi:GNAT family N-acetyltransferase [Thermoplasmatales archaeon SW_10_69_26]|nr:MAG: GNAT family N-acetyltransferase [Thermoplasmatales archaeon SW_10_69_26]
MVHLRAGTAAREDVEGIVALSETVFADASMTAWRAHHVHAHLDRFPDGQTLVRLDGDLVGSSTTMRVTEQAAMADHTWMEATGGSTLPNHDPEGDVLYGLEIMVHPDHRGKGLGRLLYEARKVLVRELGLEALVIVGRVPGFDEAHTQDRITLETYVEDVVAGKRTDPVLTKQLAVGLEPADLVPNYVVDPASHHCGVRLRWEP